MGKFIGIGSGGSGGGGGAGDMTKAVYDPNTVEGDAFDSANQVFNPAGLAVLTEADVQAALAHVDSALSEALQAALYFMVPDTAATSITEFPIFGSFIARLVGVTVDAGTPQNHIDPLRHSVAFEVTTFTAGGSARLTGDSYDPATGIVSVADTEDIVVGALGWYQSAKLWDGVVPVVLSSVDGLDVVLDSHGLSPALANDLTFDGFAAWGAATGGVNQFRILIRKFSTATGLTTIVDQTDTGIPSGEEFADGRSALGVALAVGETLLVSIFVQRMANVRVLMRFARDA